MEMRRALSLVLGLMLLFSGLMNAELVAGTGLTIDFSQDKWAYLRESIDSGGTWLNTKDGQYWYFRPQTGNAPVWSFGYDSTKGAMKLWEGYGGSTGHARGVVAVLNQSIVVSTNFTVTFQIFGSGANRAYVVGVLIFRKDGTVVGLRYATQGSNLEPGARDGTTYYAPVAGADTEYRFYVMNKTAIEAGFTNVTVNPLADLASKGVVLNPSDIAYIRVYFGLVLYDVNAQIWLKSITVKEETGKVVFSLKDALTGQSLTGVTVKEGNTTLGVIDDGGTLQLTKGTHTLTFEKSGYWSVTKTIDVQGDMSVSVEMYPSSAAFQFLNFPSDIQVYENSIYELTFTLSPISTQATYNTYLSLSGLSDVLEVRKDGQTISPESGKYYLGDISSPAQISIKFRAGSVGTHGFTITLTSNDAIMSKTYTTTKQVTYQVEPLPFSVQMPSEWQVGTNELRISESSGQSYLITAVLKDSQGNEVWSDSYAFSPYEAYTFQVNVPAEGSYTLELQWNGQTAVFDIQVNPAITLKTKQLTVEKGGEGVITLHFKNPSSSVQYYTIKVSGGFLPKEINQSISVAPLTEKDVSIAFAVPSELTYDAYELNVTVLQGDAVVFSDKVAVIISDSGGFNLPIAGGDNSWLIYAIAGLIVIAILAALARR
ncbi:peptidase associated/transthyretin-like domain-containing protein [Thermococcus barophilus]|uniref:PEGA domain-containing protein n=1 Tax=Thermococcus barophilus TaxID=55802 RepID=A0A0S1XEV1_THEBA|nr:hypothetical protein [Thermococcus barophilus]ALM76208.1 conserved exported hypothetical protein [Thermococcus barophilus]